MLKEEGEKVDKEYSVIISQVTFHYDINELQRWRTGDKFVPERYLNAKGPGLSNGYGYGEFVVERYFKALGYTVINNEFDLISKKSKYAANNNRIKNALGEEKYDKLHKKLIQVCEHNIPIKQPDLIILAPEIFFVEVKRDNDLIRDGQDTFGIVVQTIFDIPFKLYKLLPTQKNPYISQCKLTKLLPCEIMEEYK